MFTAASMPMWIAIASLIGVLTNPIIQGRVNRNNPVNKADAAEKFTRMAVDAADSYTETSQELRTLKLMVQRLIRAFDRVSCNNDDPSVILLREEVERVREKMY